jgi:hypothetical protein
VKVGLAGATAYEEFVVSEERVVTEMLPWLLRQMADVVAQEGPDIVALSKDDPVPPDKVEVMDALEVSLAEDFREKFA